MTNPDPVDVSICGCFAALAWESWRQYGWQLVIRSNKVSAFFGE